MELKAGLQGEACMQVKRGNTAIEVGSGSVPVFATPMLVAIMENAAINALKGCLPEGMSTVGVRIDCRHLVATPIGMTVTARAELVEVDNRRLLFKVEAFDEEEKVGEGEHERFIINLEKFLSRSEEKKKRFEGNKV